ncbi:PG1 [Linum perenne]
MKGISMAALLVAIVIYGGMSANAQPQPIEITPISRLLTAKPAPAGKEPAPAGGAPAAAGGGPGGVFDVMKYGAVAGGDVSQAMLKAWTEACASASPSKVVVPPGDYTAGVTKFVGPCKAPIQFEINGIIKAPPSIPGDSWLSIEDVTDLRLIGTGTLDGQGAQCWASKGGPQTADITSKDSKFFHMATLDCNNMTFSHVNVIAPATSVNTDGIHLSRSQHITITDSTIGTGDDCVSMIDNLDTITIQNTKCGPSHGISIGSLGKYQKEGPVKNIFVRQCTIANSDNGIRIKSWPDKFATACSGIHFEDITLENVENPITAPSPVEISDVTFKNVKGTSKTKEIIQLICSSAHPCLNVQMSNIDITFNGGPGVAICQNVKPVITGIMNPPGC